MGKCLEKSSPVACPWACCTSRGSTGANVQHVLLICEGIDTALLVMACHVDSAALHGREGLFVAYLCRMASPSAEDQGAGEEGPAWDLEATPSTEDERDAEDWSRAGSHPHADHHPHMDAHPHNHHVDAHPHNSHTDGHPHMDSGHSQPPSGAFPPVGPYDGPPLYKPSPVKHKRQANGMQGGRASPSMGELLSISTLCTVHPLLQNCTK